MRYTIDTTATDVDDALTRPGLYALQNVGSTDLYWGRTPEEATPAQGQLLAAGMSEDLYADSDTGGTRLYLVSVGGEGDLRIGFSRPMPRTAP